MQQISNSILMIRPNGIRANEQTSNVAKQNGIKRGVRDAMAQVMLLEDNFIAIFLHEREQPEL